MPAGRPRLEFNWTVFNHLCEIQCTEAEIAGVMEVSVDTLERRVKEQYGINFAEYYKAYSEKGKASLRRRLFKIAHDDRYRNTLTAAIWLSKQHLGYREKVDCEQFEKLEPLIIRTRKEDIKLELNEKNKK